MAIFPERNSQGGYRSVYFYIESVTSFKVMFNIFKHICLDTRKDTVTGDEWEIPRTMHIMKHTKAEICPPKACTELAMAL